MDTVRFNTKLAMVALVLYGLGPCWSWAQRATGSGSVKQVGNDGLDSPRGFVAPGTLTPDEGLAVIAAALDSRTHSRPKPDCSHLVHAIYDRAGFPYPYARSSDLYRGTDDFQRVAQPQVGDLAVWRGHVGIVVNPAQRIFFSAMRSGLEIDTYDGPYWKDRGKVRFYRYVKRNSGREATNPRGRLRSTGTSH